MSISQTFVAAQTSNLKLVVDHCVRNVTFRRKSRIQSLGMATPQRLLRDSARRGPAPPKTRQFEKKSQQQVPTTVINFQNADTSLLTAITASLIFYHCID